MSKETGDGAYPSKHINNNDETIREILATVDEFIDEYYSDLSNTSLPSATSTHLNRFLTWRSLNDCLSPNSSAVGTSYLSISSSGDESRNNSPSTRMNMDVEIERINRVCDTVDKNLRSVGVFMNNSGSYSRSEDHLSTNVTSSPPSSTNFVSDLSLDSSPQLVTVSSGSAVRRQSLSEAIVAAIPEQIIDLSETQSQTLLGDNINSNDNGDEDDDVIIISTNINPVVDLCTPGGQKKSSRRRRLSNEFSNLNRRHFTLPDVQIVDTYNVEGQSTSRNCHIENRIASNISITEFDNNIIENNSSSACKTASGLIPYMCSVCLESCLPRQPTSTRCGHIFCNECIRQAINITHKCPICKTRISKNHLFRIYP